MNITDDVYMAEAYAHLKTRVELQEYRSALRNLMAVINRDGGHHADMFPSDVEAAEDCVATVHKLHALLTEKP
jgi:hypothetical protein